MRAVLCFLLIAASVAACREHVASADERIAEFQLETLPEVIHPADNPVTPSKRLLGKLLFYDPILSGEKDIACVTCHLPNRGYADGIDLSIGVGGKGQGPDRSDFSNGRIPLLGRNSQTIINVAYNGLISGSQKYDPMTAPMFWDGRRKSIEIQCIGPPTVFNIMLGDAYSSAVTYDSLVARLKKIPEYETLFSEAFGTPNSITKENIAKAIAAFERTIVSANSAYDRYVKGDRSALTDDEKLGLQLFYTKANCVTCHSGPMFSDYNYYNLGIAYNQKRPDPDKGVDNTFVFRTPSLRNIALTAPYMHDGVLQTLEEVMAHYARATSANSDITWIDPKIQPLNLSEKETAAIISFLRALTDDSYDREVLTRVPSGLKPGGN
ncbi:cytochrome-c peroxidase [Cytophagales bacterium WSM2-2]|nr:cytochrome-c peroxidase [Cytophagales bacterium WSM2-2]